MKLEENRIFILKFELKVGDFSGGYSQTDCDFNFDINVNVTVHRNMISSFNFSFSLQVKDLRAFRIMKLESTSKMMTQFETIPQCWLFYSLFFYIYLGNKRDLRITDFFCIRFHLYLR